MQTIHVRVTSSSSTKYATSKTVVETAPSPALQRTVLPRFATQALMKAKPVETASQMAAVVLVKLPAVKSGVL